MGPSVILDQLLTAINFAALKHQDQIRKDQRGTPYITHPLSVAQAILQIGEIEDSNLLIAAVLHDTLEDTNTGEDELRDQFGEDILALILEVTDDKSLKKMERKRLQVVHASGLSTGAKILKLADKLVNCRDILLSPPRNWPLSRRQAYIQWAADVVYQIRGTNLELEHAFDETLQDAQAQLSFSIQSFETIDQRPWAPNKPL